jgi:hypothetical protein
MNFPPEKQPHTQPTPDSGPPSDAAVPVAPVPQEIGGREGPEPTRFGDWEKAGRCIDF